jgi:hypothetical protein
MRDITRREALEQALGLIAAGAAIGPEVVHGAQPAGRRVIRTLTGDLDPDRMAGSVLFHEHLSMRFLLDAASHFTDDVAMMVDEARAAKADGIGLIVDGGHPDVHRSLAALQRIADAPHGRAARGHGGAGSSATTRSVSSPARPV